MRGASFNRGSSTQDYGTTPDFLAAVAYRFGRIDWDLAANDRNAVCPRYLGPGSHVSDDALAVDWLEVVGPRSVAWLNPPFANIAPWAERCARIRDRGSWTLLLVPASVGTNWWAEHVHGKGFAFWLSPRLKFVGCADPYPKDLALVAFGFGVTGSSPWRWKA
jgi:phage N-6-adenine-methyltransferase